MINIDLRLSNPFSRRWEVSTDRSGKISNHVAYEINTYKSNTILNLYLRIQTSGDHKGVFLMLGLLGRDLEISVYDTRHES